MTGESLFIIGMFTGAIVVFIPLIIVGRIRLHSARNGEPMVLKERCQGLISENCNLRNEKEQLQSNLITAQNGVAGLESQVRAQQERIADLKRMLDICDVKINESNEVARENYGKITQLQIQLEMERKQAGEKLQLLENARDQLKNEFMNLATTIFNENSRKFSEQNRTSIDLLLNPLRDQLGDFRKRVEDVYTNDTKERQSLFEQIRMLTDLNQQVGKEAQNLTRALKGENKTQGNWGEMILERALELSGLKKGVEFETQVSLLDDDGKRQLPDVVVHIPDGRDIIVDSKVTLTAYESMVNAEDDTSREKFLQSHLASVWTHIDQLSTKSYDSLSDLKTLDYVLMFMPVEAAFVAAIREEPSLFEYAYRKRVIIVSPSTLLVTLRTIQNMWQSEYQNRNSQEIARKAADLYDKFAGFVDTLIEVKNAVSKASEKCEMAMNQLSEGKGNIVRRIEEFRKMGINTRKNLPAELFNLKTAVGDNEEP
ncbi:MAG TPA: DNA recombination protein RmuC [Chitinispirillaceae bacterium]|nr:DNA recombination protein RmuC [Chitinispirillaceae bacterium]